LVEKAIPSGVVSQDAAKAYGERAAIIAARSPVYCAATYLVI
jgi:hypothetical protein